MCIMPSRITSLIFRRLIKQSVIFLCIQITATAKKPNHFPMQFRNRKYSNLPQFTLENTTVEREMNLFWRKWFVIKWNESGALNRSFFLSSYRKIPEREMMKILTEISRWNLLNIHQHVKNSFVWIVWMVRKLVK